MANLAIKGHPRRGIEVIALLEMLGGKIRRDRLAGDELFSWYYINRDGYIDYKHYSLFDDTTVFTLEDFLEKFPYKVGDMARLSRSNVVVIVKAMKWENDEIVYKLSCNDSSWWSVDNLKPCKEETTDDDDKLATEVTIDGNKILPPNGYLIGKITQVDNGMLVEYVKQQPQYPKTYEECCDILKIPNDERYIDVDVPLDYNKSLSAFTKLLICCDAYWKIAGDWKPEWLVENKYTINTSRDRIVQSTICNANTILVFPTKEMRDAFYENFKELIEACKELL